MILHRTTMKDIANIQAESGSNKKSIRIVSPSGAIDGRYIDGAKQVLQKWGFNVSEGLHARDRYGRFAGTQADRIADLQTAINDADIDIILCSRGGYGLAQIIDKIDLKPLCRHPKLICGFSDITVLHSALGKLDLPSVHSIMAKHLTELPKDAEPKLQLQNILQGQKPTYEISSHRLNRQGMAQGILRGGNLSVLYGLRGTPYDFQPENTILFIEDIAEKPYHIDRMMQNLKLGGILQRISGLVVGQFSDCDEDPLMMRSIEEIISDAVSEYSYPVCFNFPAGHVAQNMPLIMNTEAELRVKNSVTLSYL